MILPIAAIVLSYLLGSISFSVLLAKAIRGSTFVSMAAETQALPIHCGYWVKDRLFLCCCWMYLKVLRLYGLEFGSVTAPSGFLQFAVLQRLQDITGRSTSDSVGKRNCNSNWRTRHSCIRSCSFCRNFCNPVHRFDTLCFARFSNFVALTPIFILVFPGYSMNLFWGSLIICLFAFWRHRTNIAKLARGQENKLGANKPGVENALSKKLPSWSQAVGDRSRKCAGRQWAGSDDVDTW